MSSDMSESNRKHGELHIQDHIPLRKKVTISKKPNLTKSRHDAIKDLYTQLGIVFGIYGKKGKLDDLLILDEKDLANEIHLIFAIQNIVIEKLELLRKIWAESDQPNRQQTLTHLNDITTQLTQLLATESINIKDKEHKSFKAEVERQLAATENVRKLFEPPKKTFSYQTEKGGNRNIDGHAL